MKNKQTTTTTTKKQDKQWVSCVTLLGSVKENSQLKTLLIEKKFRRFGDAKKMHTHKEREKECAHESYLKAKSWFSPLGVKVLSCVSSAYPRHVFSSADQIGYDQVQNAI